MDNMTGIARPTVETVNAAIVGFIRRQRPEKAYGVLSWASKLGISPDAVTYNTLLRPLIRDNNSKQARLLLQHMQKQGVEADVATFTTILDETFRSSDQQTSEEKQELVTTVFSEMKAAGVVMNLNTYGKIIYELLQSPNADMVVVHPILQMMAEQGLQPNSHIYTTLVEHHFKQNGPDLEAIRSLIERSKQVGSVDHIFWDRVIEGYSRAGETVSALKMLDEVKSKGHTASWVTLRTLLVALVDREEWDSARGLVRGVKLDSGAPLPEHEKGSEGQHRFWRLVNELELMDA